MKKNRADRAAKAAKVDKASEPAPGVVDPMQWWGALTQQFTQLAAGAMKDNATEAAQSLAGSIVKQSFDAAEQTLKKAVTVPIKAAGAVVKAARAARKTSGSARRKVPR